MRSSFFLLFCAVLQTIALAQWISVNPHPTANTTYIGTAPSANTYVTVTGQGEAVLTHDGGATWQVIPLPLDGIYRSSFFLDDNNGWVAGAIGSGQVRIFKTTNGGTSWTQQPNCSDTTKYDIFFIDQNIGWTIGFYGMIYKTTDGGANWYSQSNTAITNKTLYGVFATDVNNVYIAGNTDVILKSTNGGSTWTALPVIFSTSTDYRALYFPPTGTGLMGFVVGNRNRIAKTMDGGATWAQVYDPGGTNQLWAIDFNANGVGLASGATSTVLRTTDFGNTWTPITGFGSTSIIFYSVRFGSDNVAYLSGSNGYIYKSTDAGATWTELSYRFTTTSLKDVSFANDNVGYTVGTSYIGKTTNGGMAWTPQTSPYTGDINEVVAPSPNVAIAGCDGGYIIRTTNGGAQWQSVQTGITGTNSDILAIDFTDNNNGMVVAYNGTAAKTNDGGATWTMLAPITSGNPWDMDLIDTLNAYVACTGEKIYLTTDGGQSWSLQLSVGGLGTYGISALSKDVAVAGGTSGNTYYTTNGGATWNNAVTKPGYTVWGIKIKSPTLAYAACASGYIYRSTDSGMNWTLEPRVTINTFSDIDITARGDVFAVGSSGVVVKYRAQQSNCTDIHIRQGWNILSVPRAAANRAAAMLFPNKTSAAFGYDNGYIAFDTLQYGNGYWMRFANAETVNLCGNTTGLNTIPVQQGWNIIGGYDKAVPVSGVSTTPPGIITSSFFGFYNGYVSGDSLIPGKGYWIRVSQNGVLNLPSVASTAKSNPFVAATVPDGCPKIIFSDDEGFRRELYLLNSNDRINLDAFVLPPLPPSGIADARFLQSTFAEYAGAGDISIAIQRGAGQLRMECENISLAIGTANNAERKYLHPGDRYSIPVESSLLTVTAVSQVPTEFSLMQNYPNPFNPVTTISYVLPRDGAVLLKVYDALGTEVAVLVNEAKRAGQYTLTWNAGGLPSGTYFYRLQAGEFTQTRKLILMK